MGLTLKDLQPEPEPEASKPEYPRMKVEDDGSMPPEVAAALTLLFGWGAGYIKDEGA
jgi:hypothetical protein